MSTFRLVYYYLIMYIFVVILLAGELPVIGGWLATRFFMIACDYVGDGISNILLLLLYNSDCFGNDLIS